MTHKEMENIILAIDQENNETYSGYFIQDKREERDEIFNDFDEYIELGNLIYCLRLH